MELKEEKLLRYSQDFPLPPQKKKSERYKVIYFTQLSKEIDTFMRYNYDKIIKKNFFS